MNKYKTNSLALAGAINIFFPVQEVDKTNPRESVFIFPNSDKLQKIVKTFWDRTLTVSPMEYFQSLKEVKTRLYS
jgi:hypothetical protein